MSTFDEDLFLKGLEQRKATLGSEYVEKNLAAADDFTRPFQEAMTTWCWGFGCQVMRTSMGGSLR
jgi:4-carboxymuconolactone decarboxylase